MTRRELLPLGALAAIAVITAGWWALALWPLPAEGAAWVERARLVCFGASRTGLPDAGGWSLLIGQPLSMLATLLIVWPRDVTGAVRALVRTVPGRVVAGVALLATGLGIGMAGARVARAATGGSPGAAATAAETVPLEGPAPALGLVNQHGAVVDLPDLRGRPVLVAFAYAHCETVCPTVVAEARDAQARLEPRPALVVVTLDPWRDTPARLPAMARTWQLGADAHALSGSVEDVQAVLDRWGVPRARDAVNGEIVHGATVWIVDDAGRLRWRAPAFAGRIVAAVRRLS